jgi:hypothetical protein
MLLLEGYISNFTRARYYFLCVEFSDFYVNQSLTGQTIATDYSYKQIVHLTSNALIVAVQDSCRGSFRLVRANLKCDPIDAEF